MERLLAILPLLFDGLLAGIFARTLLPGRTPLITRLAALARGGDMPPEVVRYTRRVTQLWALVFSGSALAIGLVLAGVLPQAAAYAIALGHGPGCLALLLLEYGFRRWHLRKLPHPGLLEFLRFLRRVDVRALLRS